MSARVRDTQLPYPMTHRASASLADVLGNLLSRMTLNFKVMPLSKLWDIGLVTYNSITPSGIFVPALRLQADCLGSRGAVIINPGGRYCYIHSKGIKGLNPPTYENGQALDGTV